MKPKAIANHADPVGLVVTAAEAAAAVSEVF
jgi:hypothetical protein